MEKLTVTNKENTIAKFSLQECDSSILKKPENSIASDFREASPWWVPHWVKFQIFSSLERWKRHFRDKSTNNFYCGEGIMGSSITSN